MLVELGLPMAPKLSGVIRDHTGKLQGAFAALMVDEIINYVQSLQRQVELQFVRMKLASVNSSLDFSIDNLMSKDILQSINYLPHPIYLEDSSAPPFYGQHPHRNPAVHNNIPNETMTHNSVEPLDKGLCQNLGMHLPHLNGSNEGGSQVINSS
ncbi:hypothetical protein JHK85_017019 [Glycine max]|nr:hypothetical protein JHK85_017019 [Glycine max]